MASTLYAASYAEVDRYLHSCFFQGTPGLTFGKAEEKLGWNAQPTCAIMMDNVRVPAANLLGEEGKGFNIAMNACNPADALCVKLGCIVTWGLVCLHQLIFMQLEVPSVPNTLFACSEWRTHQHSQLQVKCPTLQMLNESCKLITLHVMLRWLNMLQCWRCAVLHGCSLSVRANPATIWKVNQHFPKH